MKIKEFFKGIVDNIKKYFVMKRVEKMIGKTTILTSEICRLITVCKEIKEKNENQVKKEEKNENQVKKEEKKD